MNTKRVSAGGVSIASIGAFIAAAGVALAGAGAQDLGPTKPQVKPAPQLPTPLPGEFKPAQPLDDHAGHNHADAGLVPSDAALSPLEWDSMLHDFGEIPDTEDAVHVFKFRNKLERSITIRAARAGCGCTVPDLPKKTFLPGDEGEMTVRFHPQGRRGAQPKSITIEYAEPAGTPNTQVIITSNVRPLVIVEPIKTYLTEVDTRVGKSLEMLVSGRKEGFQVTSVDSPLEHVRVTVGEARTVQIDGEEFTQYPLTVSVEPRSPIGEISTELTIHTNDERAPKATHLVFAEVVGELRANPTRLAVRAFVPNVEFSNIATIESRTGRVFNIKSIVIEGRDDMQLVADLEKGGTPERPIYTVKLAGVTPDVTGLVTGEIAVLTDLPGQETLRIPFTATLRGSILPPGAVSPLSQ